MRTDYRKRASYWFTGNDTQMGQVFLNALKAVRGAKRWEDVKGTAMDFIMTNKCCNDKDDEDVSNSGFKGKNKLTGPNDVNIHFSKFLTTMAIHHATKLRKMDDITTAKANLQGEELAKFEQLMGTLKNFAELLPPLAPGARVVAMENDYHRRKLESHREEEDDSDDEEGGDHDQVRSGAGASSWSPPLISRLQVGPGTTDQSPPVYTEQVISGTPVEQKGGAAFNTLKEAYNAVFKDPTKYVFIRKIEVMLNGTPLDQVEDKQNEDECIQAYWRMFTFNGLMNSLFTNGIRYQ